MSSADWGWRVARAMLHLDRPADIRGVTGELVNERMNLWTSLIPK
jgi:hypothetical protein